MNYQKNNYLFPVNFFYIKLYIKALSFEVKKESFTFRILILYSSDKAIK